MIDTNERVGRSEGKVEDHPHFRELRLERVRDWESGERVGSDRAVRAVSAPSWEGNGPSISFAAM